jgi:hypothetical protein
MGASALNGRHSPDRPMGPLCARSGPSAWAPPKQAIRIFVLTRPLSSASISVPLMLRADLFF